MINNNINCVIYITVFLPCRHIVQFKGIGCEQETSVEAMRRSMYFVEEFLEGGTLEQLILNQMDHPR